MKSDSVESKNIYAEFSEFSDRIMGTTPEAKQSAEIQRKMLADARLYPHVKTIAWITVISALIVGFCIGLASGPFILTWGRP